jgi:ABC-type nickel/cobalt efflux system permease component RcnA
MAKVLAHLKGIVASLWPAWEIYQAGHADQTLTQPELAAIGEALLFAGGVWLVPNWGYLKTLRKRRGDHQVRDEVQPQPLTERQDPESTHEWEQRP